MILVGEVQSKSAVQHYNISIDETVRIETKAIPLTRVASIPLNYSFLPCLARTTLSLRHLYIGRTDQLHSRLSARFSPDISTPTNHNVQVNPGIIRWSSLVRAMYRRSPNTFKLTIPPQIQEDPVASLLTPEGPAAQAPALRGPGRRHRQRRTRAQRTELQGRRAVVRGDAARGGDAAKGQVHSVR
jgi:hypothetical protein